MQTHRGAVAPGRLDRRNDLDPAAVDGGAAGVLDRLGQVRGGDGAEEAAVRAGGGDDGDDVLGQPGAGLLGLLQGLDGALAAGLGHLVELTLRALGPRGGQLAGQEVVAGVTVLDLDDVADRAEVGHVVGENELGGHHASDQRAELE